VLPWEFPLGRLSTLIPLQPQENPLNEYQLKASFLYNFAKFIEWPESTFANASSTFKFCAFGKDPFGKPLDDLLLDKKILERSVELLRAHRLFELDGCQVVFISSSENAHFREAVARLRGHNVLLVGEAEEFASSGGATQFFL
jgi:hypothetical protein